MDLLVKPLADKLDKISNGGTLQAMWEKIGEHSEQIARTDATIHELRTTIVKSGDE